MAREVASQSIFYGQKPDREGGLNPVSRIHSPPYTVGLLPFYGQNLISEIVKCLVI